MALESYLGSEIIDTHGEDGVVLLYDSGDTIWHNAYNMILYLHLHIHDHRSHTLISRVNISRSNIRVYDYHHSIPDGN